MFQHARERRLGQIGRKVLNPGVAITSGQLTPQLA
jgi:hypothetical protein